VRRGVGGRWHSWRLLPAIGAGPRRQKRNPLAVGREDRPPRVGVALLQRPWLAGQPVDQPQRGTLMLVRYPLSRVGRSLAIGRQGGGGGHVGWVEVLNLQGSFLRRSGEERGQQEEEKSGGTSKGRIP